MTRYPSFSLPDQSNQSQRHALPTFQLYARLNHDAWVLHGMDTAEVKVRTP